MTDAIHRKVIRIERVRDSWLSADATFYECGHMYRFAPDLGPPVGAQRRCYACEHAAKLTARSKPEET